MTKPTDPAPAGQPPGTEPNPLAQAQELVYDAWEADSADQAADLARQALEISQDCADAYNVLVMALATTPEERLDLYRKARRAGRRALGDQAFEALEGSFWGVLETRPYMRALQGEASSLVELDRIEEATAVYERMLELNPNDNQGVRDILLALYLQMGRVDEAQGLVDRYEQDASATFAWARVLATFLTDGPETAEDLLDEAVATNEHVPGLLFTDPDQLPEPGPSYRPGHESEAVHYVHTHQAAWREHPEALAWLQDALEG